MSTVQSGTAIVLGGEGDRHQADGIATPEPVALMSAVATVLRDTIDRFTHISGKVTEMVLSNRAGADVELVVALQDFDRLQQEFAALNDVFSSCIDIWCAPAGGDQKLHDPIAEVTLADLKGRLSSRARSEAILMSTGPSNAAEDVF